MTNLNIGNKIPDFTFISTDEKLQSLQQLQGKTVVLYFYPKDNTPGCTTESKEFRDFYPQFQKLNAVILGISRDNLKSHNKFSCDHALPFNLISDTDETLCNLFAVIKPKNMYGKTVRGIERSTFLIDDQGVLRKEWRKVSVTGHVAEVLSAIQEIFNHTNSK
jgi:thioredoxin-dependent peroxiredoxin